MALLRSDIINKEFVEMVLRKAEVGGETFSLYRAVRVLEDIFKTCAKI